MVYEFMLENRKKLIAHAQEFRSIFGRQMKEFWEPVTGFDVVKFDAFINPHDHESTYQAILRLYGQERVEFVRNLI